MGTPENRDGLSEATPEGVLGAIKGLLTAALSRMRTLVGLDKASSGDADEVRAEVGGDANAVVTANSSDPRVLLDDLRDRDVAFGEWRSLRIDHPLAADFDTWYKTKYLPEQARLASEADEVAGRFSAGRFVPCSAGARVGNSARVHSRAVDFPPVDFNGPIGDVVVPEGVRLTDHGFIDSEYDTRGLPVTIRDLSPRKG